MKKRIISLVLSSVMILSLTGCGSKVEKIIGILLEDETTTVVENNQQADNTIKDTTDNNVVENNQNNNVIENNQNNNVENSIGVESGTTFLTMVYDESGKSAEDIAVAFLRHIRNEEYDKLVPLMVDKGAKFVKGSDIYDIWFKNGSEYLKITDKDCLVETKMGSMNEGKSRVYIKLKTTDTNYDNTLFECNIPVILNEDNLWRVDLIDDLAVQEYGVVLPKGCTLNIDGVEVNRDIDVIIRPYEDNIELEVWEFAHISEGEKELTVKSPVFEVKANMTPNKDNYTFKPTLEVSDELAIEVCEFAKGVFVELLNSAANEAITLEQIEKYVSVNAETGTAGNILEYYKEESENMINKKYRNIEVSKVISHPTEINYWYNDNCMVVHFGLSVSWEDPGFGGQPKWVVETMDRYFSIKVEYVDDGFKIASADTNLFSNIMLLNSATDDF